MTPMALMLEILKIGGPYGVLLPVIIYLIYLLAQTKNTNPTYGDNALTHQEITSDLDLLSQRFELTISPMQDDITEIKTEVQSLTSTIATHESRHH